MPRARPAVLAACLVVLLFPAGAHAAESGQAPVAAPAQSAPPPATGTLPQNVEPPTAPSPASPSPPSPPALLVPGVPAIPYGPVAPFPVSPPGGPEILVSPPPPTIPSVAPALIPFVAPDPSARKLEFHPNVGFAEDYTDNFTRTHTGRITNLRSSGSPGFRLLINHPLLKGTVNYTLAESYDSSTSALNTFHAFLGQTSWQATPRLTLGVSDALTRSDEPTLADRLNLRRERRTFTSNLAAVTADYALPTITARAYYRHATFRDEGATDTETDAIGTTASKRLGETNNLGVGYEYSDVRTTRNTTPTSATPLSGLQGVGANIPTAGTHGHQLTASLSRQFTSLFTAGVSGSYAVRTPTDGRPDTFQLWTASVFTNNILAGRFTLHGNIGIGHLTAESGASRTAITSVTALSYTFSRASVTLGIDRGFSETSALGQNFGVIDTQGVTASLNYPFTDRITATGGLYYRENSSTGAAGGQRNTSEQSYGTSLVLRAELRPWLHVGLDYFHTNFESSRANNSYSENRIRATLNADF